MLGIGNIGKLGKLGGGGASRLKMTTQYKALYDTLTTKPTRQTATAQNTFIKTLVDAGIFDKLSCLMPVGAGMGNITDAILWWNDPTKSGTPVNSPAFDSELGITGNGTDSYVNTNWNPSTDPKFTQNNASFGIYFSNQVNSNATAVTACGCSVKLNSMVSLVPQSNSTASFAINGPNSNKANTTGTNRFFIVTRESSSQVKKYYNDETPTTTSNTSYTPPNLDFFLLARNASGTPEYYMTNSIGLFFAGSALSSAEITTLVDAYFLMINSVGTNELFTDTGDSTEIDTNKWTVTLTDATKAIISMQRKTLNIETNAKAANADHSGILLKSKTAKISGEFMFSAFLPNGRTNIANYLCGLRATDNSFIGFYRLGNSIKYRITNSAGTVEYEVELNTSIKDLILAKISIDRKHNISAWNYVNDAWVQLGVTRKIMKPEKAIILASVGANFTSAGIRDVQILKKQTYQTFNSSSIATDARIYGATPDGTTDSTTAINKGLLAGNLILQNGYYVISSAIEIPDNTTLYLKNVRIYLADESYNNVFRNKNFVEGSENVKIIGLGNVVVDGNGINNFDDTWSNNWLNIKYRKPIIFIGNCDGFEIENINIVDKQKYSGVFQKARNGSVKNMWDQMISKTANQDGYCVEWGSNYIDFDNIHGVYGDDSASIYLGQLSGALYYPYPDLYPDDVHHITYNDIKCQSIYHTMIYITGDGCKIHDIERTNIDVIDCLFSCYFNNLAYVTTPPMADDLKDITVNNITVRSTNAAYPVFSFVGNMTNVDVINFINYSDSEDYIVDLGTRIGVSINGVEI